MSRTVHFVQPDQDNKIYCRWLDRFVTYGQKHFHQHCHGDCTYLHGSIQGTGVECNYDEKKPPREG